eukprot:TRINITY_DN25975_c0_g2_i1.p1 TRINITY_DN25975_c0_g2~~TRINITY_DN25975_c0_g2_i1.p1  ORF type:complete len:114 (-),score=15.89 TRINITY_DN25975_c0_g2_i1:25-366(-)
MKTDPFMPLISDRPRPKKQIGNVGFRMCIKPLCGFERLDPIVSRGKDSSLLWRAGKETEKAAAVQEEERKEERTKIEEGVANHKRAAAVAYNGSVQSAATHNRCRHIGWPFSS